MPSRIAAHTGIGGIVVEKRLERLMFLQQLVLVAQACLLRRHAPAAVADAFIATRCGPCASGGVLGASPVQGLDSAAILQRALPY